MNENEIITALECCEMQSYPACRECPYHDHYSNGNCISKKNADIKDLIKILKEENEELKCRTQNLTSDLTSAKTEIERLEKAFVILKNHNNHLEKVGEEYVEAIIRLEKLNETAKSEARKEFAERLKCGVPQETGVIRCKDVGFTLAGLTERKEDEDNV